MPEYKNFYLTVVNGCESPIGSVNELKAYLNHLFRTDKAQRWTNSITPKNWAIMPAVDRDDVFYLGEGKDRKYLNQLLVQTIRALLLDSPDDHLIDCDVIGFLYTFKIIWTDDNDATVNQPFGVEELAGIVQKFYNVKESILLTVVCHQDEEYPHLHGLFVWVPGDINRISHILASKDVEIDGSSEDELTDKLGIEFATENEDLIKPVSETKVVKQSTNANVNKVKWSDSELESDQLENNNLENNSNLNGTDSEGLNMDESEEDE